MDTAYILISLVPGTEEMYYSNGSEEGNCIAHIRGDFGGNGSEYYASLYPHNSDIEPDDDYKEHLTRLMRFLRKNLLKNRSCMRRFIAKNPSKPLEDGNNPVYGYQTKDAKYRYYIRCTPYPGYYDFYIYMYFGKTE